MSRAEHVDVCSPEGDPSCAHRPRCIQIRWLIAGIIFGAFFPLIGALAAGALGRGLVAAHRSQPVLFIVDTAPVVLGLTGYAIGHFHARLNRIRHRIELFHAAR